MRTIVSEFTVHVYIYICLNTFDNFDKINPNCYCLIQSWTTIKDQLMKQKLSSALQKTKNVSFSLPDLKTVFSQKMFARLIFSFNIYMKHDQ